jgi:glycine cleavage system H protein
VVNVPGGVYLAPEHTWVKVELAGDARIGLDDFFHKLVGAAGSIRLPEPGRNVRRGETLFAIETDGEALPFPSPVAGKVVQVNHDLDYQLDLMRLRPYDQGWICTIDPEHLSSDLERLVIGADAVDRYQADVRRYDLRLAEELAATPLPGKKEAHDGEAERRAACRAFARCFLPAVTPSRRETPVATGA